MIAAHTQQPTYLLYNADETLNEFRERQRAAYQAGALAWREGLINGQALQLYNELVRCVGANKFAWIKEDTLAKLLGRSASTLKRWMSQLVGARLIQRGRRFGSASLTYIMAYEQSSEPKEQSGAVSESATNASSPYELPQEHNIEPQAGSVAISSSNTQTDLNRSTQECNVLPAAPFFAATSEPSIGSFSRRHTIKSQHVNIKGGGIEVSKIKLEDIEDNQTTARLRAEGVEDLDVLQELKIHPVGEIERVIRYVARCRSDDDPRRPGLIVHLLRNGFGKHRRSSFDGRRPKAQGNPRASGTREPVSASDDPRRYLSHGFCHHGLYGNCPHCDPSASTTILAEDADHRHDVEEAPEPVKSVIVAQWKTVLARLAQKVGPAEFSTWLETVTLIDIIGNVAIIGTPNVFVRNQVRDECSSHLSQALAAELGHAVQIEVVIDVPVAV